MAFCKLAPHTVSVLRFVDSLLHEWRVCIYVFIHAFYVIERSFVITVQSGHVLSICCQLVYSVSVVLVIWHERKCENAVSLCSVCFMQLCFFITFRLCS